MAITEKLIIPRIDLLKLIEQCTGFIKTVRRGPSIQISTQDKQWLSEQLAEIKDIFKKAEDLKIIKLEKLPRGLWPGFEAHINDQKELFSVVAPTPTDSQNLPRKKGEKFHIKAGNLPQFFESCAGFIRNHAEDLSEGRPMMRRHRMIIHGLIDPGLPLADPNRRRYEIV